MDDIEELLHARRHWIGGGWRPSRGSGLFEVIDPSSEQVLGVVSSATGQDVDDAVREASRALPAWSQTPLEDRLVLLARLCDVIESNIDEFASLITREVGAPVAISAPMHVGLALEIFRSFIEQPGNCRWRSLSGSHSSSAGEPWRWWRPASRRGTSR